MSAPARAGASSARRVDAASAGRPFAGRGSSTIASAWSGRASATTASTRFRKARVVFAFSHDPVLEPGRDPDRGQRQQLAQVGRRARARPGRACSERGRANRRRRSRRRSGRERLDAGTAQQGAGADQRQADERRRIVGLDRLEQGDAERLGLGAAGAVVRAARSAGSTRSRRHWRRGSEPSRRRRRPRAAASLAPTTATAVWKTTRPAAHRPQLLGRALVRSRLADGGSRRARRPGPSR